MNKSLKIGFIILTFVVFMLIFTFMFSRTDTPQANEVARTSVANDLEAGADLDETEDAAAEMAEEPMMLKAAAPEAALFEAKVEEEGNLVDDVIIEESKFNFLSSIWGIMIISLFCTLISWSAVEQVMKKRRNVMLVSFHDAKGKKVMQAMANETSKKVLDILADGGMTASEVAEKLGMSISRIHYNLKQLEDAKLIQAKSYKYSEKGKEMDVYTLTNKYVVIGPPERKKK